MQMNAPILATILVIGMAAVVAVSAVGLGIYENAVSRHNAMIEDNQCVSYTVYGNHTGHLVFCKDNYGYAVIDGIPSSTAYRFSWEVNNGIRFDDTIHTTIRYWGYEVETILFPGNLTTISPQIPDQYAVMETDNTLSNGKPVTFLEG